MSEVWVSYPELADVLGEAAAGRLCARVGGTPLFVPRTPAREKALSALLGEEGMARLCAAFGGLRVVFPNRRREPHKPRIIRLLEAGEPPRSIALEIGVTERYVRQLARRVRRQPPPPEQLRLC